MYGKNEPPFEKVTARQLAAIKEGVKALMGKSTEETVRIVHYGDYKNEPSQLTFIIVLETEQTKARYSKNQGFLALIKDVFLAEGYPSEALSSVSITFDADEAIKRDSDGNAWYHFR